jgi:hypothetical protein
MKNSFDKKITLLIFFNITYACLGTSIVYNFRIAQITRQSISDNQNNPHPNNLSALVFNQYQKKYNDSKQNFTGELSSYIRDLSPYYFRADFAFAHVQNKVDHTKIYSGTQTDDLLFTAGRNFTTSNKNTITLSGLFGVPTHNMKLLLHPEFGYAQVGLGAQLDGVYSFTANSALIYGTRYIYFVPRTTYDNLENRYKFTAGNNVDFILASKYDFDQNGIEFGYTNKCQFGTKIIPQITDLFANHYISSSFYLVYKHRFLIYNLPSRFLANIAYGFNHKQQALANKTVITGWVAWNISF